MFTHAVDQFEQFGGIADKIEDFISEEVLNGKVLEHQEYILTTEEENIVFKEIEVKKYIG